MSLGLRGAPRQPWDEAPGSGKDAAPAIQHEEHLGAEDAQTVDALFERQPRE